MVPHIYMAKEPYPERPTSAVYWSGPLPNNIWYAVVRPRRDDVFIRIMYGGTDLVTRGYPFPGCEDIHSFADMGIITLSSVPQGIAEQLEMDFIKGEKIREGREVAGILDMMRIVCG